MVGGRDSEIEQLEVQVERRTFTAAAHSRREGDGHS